MRQRKELIYNPMRFWKMKIGFDVNEEVRIYRYLCGSLRSKREIEAIDVEKRFKTYKLWREYVVAQLQECDDETLYEFYHFLRLKETQCDIGMGVFTSFFGPIFVSIITGLLVQMLISFTTKEYFSSVTIESLFSLQTVGERIVAIFGIIIALVIVFILGGLIAMAVFFAIVKTFLDPYIETKYEVTFWRDYLEIVEEEKNKRTNLKNQQES